jgi:hypothetical protein
LPKLCWKVRSRSRYKTANELDGTSNNPVHHNPHLIPLGPLIPAHSLEPPRYECKDDFIVVRAEKRKPGWCKRFTIAVRCPS